jgi:hypothetical protein
VLELSGGSFEQRAAGRATAHGSATRSLRSSVTHAAKNAAAALETSGAHPHIECKRIARRLLLEFPQETFQ